MRIGSTVATAATCAARLALTHSFEAGCEAIASKLDILNGTVWFSQYVPAGTNLTFPDNNITCNRPYQVVPKDICRIALYVATSNRSGVSVETWLPRDWTGRFLSTGNGGLSGCIQYEDMAYTSGLGFATVSGNNGHNGTSGGAFYNNPNTLEDFVWRSVYTGVVVGKQISRAFYGAPHKKSYYLGCSTGGRQGLKMVQDFPDAFDGVVAGAPANAFNNLTSWSGHFYTLNGTANSSTAVPASMWPVIHQDILNQCDGIDGYVDGILEDPDLCQYRPESLICGPGNTINCLTGEQANTVRQFFSPLYGLDGSLVYPRMQPGSERQAAQVIYNIGRPFPYTTDWFRYAIYNDPSWDPTKLNATDYAVAARVNPFNVETWKGDLSAFRDRGGKLLTYHGLMDGLISSDNSERYYNHVSRTMGLPSSSLDSFYRFFRIAGMEHCGNGPGAWEIGQSRGNASLSPDANILTAMVRWVESGTAPESILGTKYVNDTVSAGVLFQRAHCKYPTRNVYPGTGDPTEPTSWRCI